MPYASRRQQRWAFATGQPFAKRWAKETPDFAALPEKKDAGTTQGAQLHGPGGLLATPGMRKWGRRKPRVTTKPMTRSQAARVAALARWGKYTPRPGEPKAPRRSGGKRASAQTAQQHQSARDAQRQTRERERQAQREAKRTQVYERMGIPPEGRAALEALRRGEPPDPEAIQRGGFVDAGLVEQAADGSYRMTPAGRALTGAADVGDVGRAGDTISGARDRLSARRARRAAQEERKRGAAGSGGAGGGKPNQAADRRAAVTARRMARTRKRLADAFDRARGRRVPPGPVRQTTKAQTAQERAMFAKMGGGGKGSGGGGSAWKKGPDGKRHPSAAQVGAMQSKLDADKAKFDKNTPTDVVARGRARASLAQRQRDLNDHKERAEHAHDRLDHQLRDKRNEINARLRRVKPDTQEQRDLVRYLKDIEDAISTTKRNRRELAAAGKSFAVFKDASGAYRWIARSTTAYRDRDGEIITSKALDADAARMTASGQYGPLRYWHIGRPDPFNPAAPWGPGVDIGDCDYSALIGRTSIESGTFKNQAIGQAFAESAGEYELSPGFFHPPDQPNAAGEYDTIRRFERSVVPIKYGRASNLFTGMTVKAYRAIYKAQTDEEKAMFANMGGGRSGGGGKGGGKSTLWPKGPDGKRTPQAAAAETRAAGGSSGNKPKAGPRDLTDSEKYRIESSERQIAKAQDLIDKAQKKIDRQNQSGVRRLSADTMADYRRIIHENKRYIEQHQQRINETRAAAQEGN